jgi:hypothetical protein
MKNLLIAFIALLPIVFFSNETLARDINYSGGEQTIYVSPGEPTQINFPGKIEGGYKSKNSPIALEKQDNYLIVFANDQLTVDGSAVLVHLADKRSYAIRIRPATSPGQKDVSVNILDPREAEAPETTDEQGTAKLDQKENAFAPPTAVAGLMREMMLISEFGKKSQITGYRKSNRYSGETVLHDGTLEAKIDQIYMGTDMWGYILNVENLLNTSHKINPATFRLDGTKAISAQRWELSARPVNGEQQLANVHKGKVYIVTAAKRK